MHPLPVAVAWLALAGPALAQSTGRTLSVSAPPVVGYTAVFQLNHPVGAAGNFYAFLWCMPQFAGTFPLSVPGMTLHGTLRVDPATTVAAFTGMLGGSGSVQHTLAVPNDPSFTGVSWDLQTADLAAASLAIYFSDNELALSITQIPPSNLVPIAPGTFAMGSNASTSSPYLSDPIERPVHQVTISRPFWIGAHEVTQAEYLAVMSTNPSFHQGPAYPNSPQRPVENVTWFQARAYCQALTAIEQAANRVPTGYQYRLPTEAEWEYCCRAGTTSEYAYGPTLACSQASFNYSYHTNTTCGTNATSVVGSHAANAWGLYDTHGNVTEWCRDAGSWTNPYAVSTYPTGPVVDPFVSAGSEKALRGGSYGDFSFRCRSAYRAWRDPFGADRLIGFRVVLGPIMP